MTRARLRTVGAALAVAMVLSGCATTPVIGGGADVASVGETDRVAGPPVPEDAFTARVTHHSDGDTLWVDVVDPGGTRIDTSDEVKLRLLRIDTPELARDGDPAECLAEAATDALRDLIPEGATVRGGYDVEMRDRFGRDLVHLWTSDGTWVNGWMLDRGFASVVTFPPNTAFDDEVRDLERAARDASRGLWDPAAC